MDNIYSWFPPRNPAGSEVPVPDATILNRFVHMRFGPPEKDSSTQVGGSGAVKPNDRK